MAGAVTKRDDQRDECRQRLQRRSEHAREAPRSPAAVASQHGADADRIDVVKMRALELDARRAQAQRLVDHEIGDQRADPGDGDDRVEAEDVLEHFEDAELHQQQRDGDVEHQPHHAAGMAMREAREEIRPGDRARIGVGDVDLELRDDDEGAGEGERHLRRGKHVLESDEIHLRRFDRLRPAAPSARWRETPGTIRPAASACRERSSPDRPPDSATHQPRVPASPRAGRKRRKSTCSPICAISENTTVEAAPNRTRLNELAVSARAALRSCVQPSNDALSAAAMKRNGMRCSTIHIGCVQN